MGSKKQPAAPAAKLPVIVPGPYYVVASQVVAPPGMRFVERDWWPRIRDAVASGEAIAKKIRQQMPLEGSPDLYANGDPWANGAMAFDILQGLNALADNRRRAGGIQADSSSNIDDWHFTIQLLGLSVLENGWLSRYWESVRDLIRWFRTRDETNTPLPVNILDRFEDSIRQLLTLDANHGTATPEEPNAPRRSCYGRDHTWRQWRKDDKLKDAAIRDKWNRLSEDERRAICPGRSDSIPGGKPGASRVRSALAALENRITAGKE